MLSVPPFDEDVGEEEDAEDDVLEAACLAARYGAVLWGRVGKAASVIGSVVAMRGVVWRVAWGVGRGAAVCPLTHHH